MSNFKKTVVFDFDGVVHSYTSGWKGIDVIPDPPVEGIKNVLHTLQDRNFKVVIVSTRCEHTIGILAIHEWLDKHKIIVDEVLATKPPAICYVDDRAINFNGDVEGLIDKVANFKRVVKTPINMEDEDVADFVKKRDIFLEMAELLDETARLFSIPNKEQDKEATKRAEAIMGRFVIKLLEVQSVLNN